jgi:hypothetical protein
MNMNYRRIITCLKNTGSHMMLVGLRIKSRKSSASGKEHESLNLWLKRRGGSAVSAKLLQIAQCLLPHQGVENKRKFS